MTQVVEKPIQLNYDKLLAKFQASFKQLVAPLERAREKIERGEGTQDLAKILGADIDRKEEPTAFVYTWQGQTGQSFEYRVLKPFEPTPEPRLESPQEPPEPPASQEESTPSPQETQTNAQAPAEAQDAEETTADTPQPATKTPSSSSGLFSALAKLIGESTLLMTLAKHEDELTVNVMPFGEDQDSSISAICLTGTPAELDEGFVEAVSVKVQGRKSFAEQLEALKVAEKELVDAKKAEADQKKAEADKKKKAAEAKKKEAEKKKKEEQEAAQQAGKQEAIF